MTLVATAPAQLYGDYCPLAVLEQKRDYFSIEGSDVDCWLRTI